MLIIYMGISIMFLTEFHKLVNSKEPVFICGTATWCKPCKEFKSQVESVGSAERGNFYLLDADKDSEVITYCAINAFPTMQVWVNSVLVSESIGKHIDINATISKYGKIEIEFNNNVVDF